MKRDPAPTHVVPTDSGIVARIYGDDRYDIGFTSLHEQSILIHNMAIGATHIIIVTQGTCPRAHTNLKESPNQTLPVQQSHTPYSGFTLLQTAPKWVRQRTLW